jgi:hypothetical protein
MNNAIEFTIEELQKDDPRLKQLLQIPPEERQPSRSVTLQLVGGSDELEIENVDRWHQFGLTNEDFNHLKSLGLTGKLRVCGYESAGYAPFKARTLIVAQHQIKEPVDLLQPDNCEIIYYQVGNEWRKFPEDAPVLKKRFRLSPDPTDKNLTNIWTEAYYGSESGGGGGFNWGRVGVGYKSFELPPSLRVFD